MAESVLDEIEEKQEEDEVSQFVTDLLTFIERQAKQRATVRGDSSKERT